MSVGCSRTTSTVFSEVFIFVFLSWLGLLGLALYADTISAYGESVNGNRTIFAFIFGFRKSLKMRRMPNKSLERTRLYVLVSIRTPLGRVADPVVQWHQHDEQSFSSPDPRQFGHVTR